MITSQPSSATPGSGNAEELGLTDDYIDLLHVVTQETRYNLLQLIVGHPERAPSLEELTYMATDVNNKATVHEHLEELIAVGVVERIEKEHQPSEYPRVFYTVPRDVLTFLQERGLLENVTALQEIYEATEKPENVQKAEEAPRPTEAYVGDIDEEVVLAVLREFVNEHEDAEKAAEKLDRLRTDVEDESLKKWVTETLGGIRTNASLQPHPDE